MAYDNNMSGALFKNDRKQTENQPDYKGSCEINNVQYWMSSWIKKDKNGNSFMSFAFTPKEQQGENKVETAAVVDGEVPF